MKNPRFPAFLALAAVLLAAILLRGAAGPALAQPLSPGGASTGWTALSPGRAAGLFRARQMGGGSVILMGLGTATAGGVALVMAVPDKQAGAQGAVINSTTGTTP